MLFGDLPLVSSEAELTALKAAHPDADPCYIASGSIKERRERFESLWPAFTPYADRNFLAELEKHFHQRSWEMFLGNVLLQKGLPLSPHSDAGPDFVIGGDNPVYVECVAPTKGSTSNQDAVPEPRSFGLGEELTMQPVPEEQILLRITQAITEKVGKYDSWRAKTWFKPDVPYIIAVNTGELNYPDNPSMQYVLKALFGASHMYLEFAPGSAYRSQGWIFRDAIQRASGSNVAVNQFAGPGLSQVSGILFSDNTVLAHTTFTDLECLLVNNPFAVNPLPDFFTACFNGWKARLDGHAALIDAPTSIRVFIRPRINPR
jgi:hypothetical protein